MYNKEHDKNIDFNNLRINKNCKILFKEAAILIESKAYLEMDKIILVTCPKEIIIKRILNKNN